MGKTLCFIVDVQTPDRGVVATNVDIQFDSDFPDWSEVVEKVEEIADEACKNVASDVVDFEATGGDSAYLDLLDKVADQYPVLAIKKAAEGVAPQRFYFEGRWPSGENMFGEHVMAVDEDDAAFQGIWTMATHPVDGVEGPLRKKNRDALASFMASVDVEMNHPEPITQDEAIELLRKVYAANRFGHPEDMEEAIEQIHAALELAGKLPEEPSAAPSM